MKKLIIGFAMAALAALAALVALPALAADLRVKAIAPALAPAYDWSGFYIGGQAGGAWSESSVTNVTGTHFFNFIGDSRSMSASNALGGVFVGVQKQFGVFVLGAEGGSAWGTISRTVQSPGPFALDNYN